MSLMKKVQKAAAWSLGRLLPIQNNKIVVSSFYGRGYSDNPKAVVDALLKRGEDLDIVWVVKDEKTADLPKGVRAVQYDSVELIRELSTAKIWIDNCRKGARYKKKGQYYLQTWHGLALKRIEKDVADKLNTAENNAYAAYAIRDSKQIDLIVSCSDFMTGIYQNSFWYDGPVEVYGAPRNDIMFHPSGDMRHQVAQRLHLPEDCKWMIYAPTFRADGSLDAYNMDYAAVCQAMEERFGGRWIMLIRLHPAVMQKAKELKFDNKLTFDATAYNDMQELLSACDAVVTDYSSLMFDFALTHRPCFQYAADIEAYKGDRNFYFPIDETPFPLAVNNDEMVKNIHSFDETVYAEKWDAFVKKMGLCENGNASERCADWVLEHMKL